MRIAEVFLRIGSTLVAWMLVFAYFIWLSVVDRVGCGPEGDEIYRLMLGMAPLFSGAAFLLRMARPFPDIHAILRWLGIPVFGLALLTLPIVWQVLTSVNFAGEAICAGTSRAGWQAFWAPLQLIVIAYGLYCVGRMWRKEPGTES